MAEYFGLYYRARVLGVSPQHIIIYYVDYGNTREVPLFKLFKWEKYFEQLPFQAVKFRIGGIKPRTKFTQSKRATALMENIGQQMLQAVVL